MNFIKKTEKGNGTEMKYNKQVVISQTNRPNYLKNTEQNFLP